MDGIIGAFRDVATVVSFRALPCAAFAIATRRIRLLPRVMVLCATAAGILLIHRYQLLELEAVVSAYAYFVALSCLTPYLSWYLRAGGITTGATFVACAAAFFFVPALLWPPNAKAAVVLVLGWDLMLSSYSYCIEVSKGGAPPLLADTVFFLIVNPALVYTQRGESTGPPQWNARGLGRVAQAIVVFFAVSVVLLPLYESLRFNLVSRSSGAVQIAVTVVACGAMRFTVQYARQSALASLQIGLLRQLGYVIPERYVWPIFASGPADFFRRWNTYVGQWLLRYVFWPLSFHLAQGRRPRAYRSLVTVISVMTTFFACGALHDATAYGSSLVVKTQMVQVFFVGGALVVLSRVLAVALDESVRAIPSIARLSVASPVLARAGLWVSLVTVFFRWFP